MASSQPSSSLASPPTQLESFLLCLNDCSQDELENSLEVCKWVLEVLDSDTNGIVRLDAWADLCVSLAKASRCKKTGEDPRKFFNTGILDVAPFCHLGMMDISDLAGTSFMEPKGRELLGLHSFIKKNNLVAHFPWLQSVQDEIQLLHLDLTGAWDTDLMT